MQTIGIIGYGSWATALAKILSSKTNTQIYWHIPKQTDIAHFETHRSNPRYLQGVKFATKNIHFTTNLQECINQSQYIILACPSAFLANTIDACTLPINKFYITAIKGIEPKSKLVIAEYLEQYKNVPTSQIILVTGPCHAEEVALEKLSYLTVSSQSIKEAKKFATLLTCSFIHTHTNTDLYGSEYSAVMKNIYAIGAGILHGLGYGDNFLAVYVSAAIREIELFLESLHKTHRDVKDAAYLGDLLVTCYSQFSRNRTFGNMIGKGYSTKTAQLEMNMIAEGYYALESIETIRIKNTVTMPIVETIYAIVYKNANPKESFNTLASILN